MKKFFAPLCLTVALALAGCSANTISGPDLAPTEDATIQEGPSYAPQHNEEGADKGTGGESGESTRGNDHNNG